jgi:hypothetical protein
MRKFRKNRLRKIEPRDLRNFGMALVTDLIVLIYFEQGRFFFVNGASGSIESQLK